MRDGSHHSQLLFVTSQVNEMRRLNSSESQIKPKRDAFDFHLQRGAVAYILYFWINLSKECVCIREFTINSEDIHCISSPEDGSLSLLQRYQRVFDLTADFSPSETNRHGWRLRFVFFLYSCLLRFWWENVATCSVPPSGALESSPPPLSVFLALWSGSWNLKATASEVEMKWTEKWILA